MRVFLAAHRARFAAVGIEQHGGLADGATFLYFIDLPLHLEIDCLLHEAEGIQVLDLAPGAERFARAAHRDVGVAAKRAFLHVAVTNADPLHQCVQRLGIGDRLGGRAHVRLGDDFQQRRTGAIQVDAGPAVKILMQRLAGIFFEMGAGEPDELLGRRVTRADSYRESTAGYHRRLELTDLIALGQIGVEIILAGEDRARRDLRADRQAKLDGTHHGLAIEYRQDAGQRDVDRVGLHIWLGAEGDAAAGKYLRFGSQLGVGFQPDDDFPAHFATSGICVCQSVAFWYWCATLSIFASPNQLPMICKPTGIGFAN